MQENSGSGTSFLSRFSLKKIRTFDSFKNPVYTLFYCGTASQWASGSMQGAKEKISNWYDEAQDRLIGSYKRNLQIWIFIISLILVGITDADTIKLASYLYGNSAAREAIAIKASLFVNDSSIFGLISRIALKTFL